MSFRRVLLAWILCGGVLSAQSAAQVQAEISQHEGPATFSSHSNLVQVPVVVRDGQGRPVSNLTKDDFFLFDKGKPQFISKFIVERAGTPHIPAVGATQTQPAGETSAVPTVSPFDHENATGPPIPERFIAYLLDDVHLNTGDLARLRNATLEHIDQSLDPVTRVAIVTTSGADALDFTDDIAKIHATLYGIKPYTQLPTSPNNCPDISLYMADLIINKQDQQALAVATADASTCSQLATNSSSLPGLVRAAAISALSIGEAQSKYSLDSVVALTKRMTAMPGNRTIVLISPGFVFANDDLQIALTDLLDKAIRGNVTINTLDARGVFTVIPGGDASTRTASTSNLTLRTSYDMSASIAQQDVLEELAYGTGGIFFHNDNGFAEGLQQLTKQPEFAYLLGFSPADLKYDGQYHAVKVTLKNPSGLTLQARRGYYAPKRPNDPEEAAKEDIREAVFSRDELQDIPIAMRLQFFKSSANSAKLSVISHVDVKSLHFQKDEDRSKDTLVIVAGLFDRNGNFISGTQRTVEMNLRDQTRNTLETNGINIPANFDVSPGAYTIRVVVRDSQGQTMAAKNGVVQIP